MVGALIRMEGANIACALLLFQTKFEALNMRTSAPRLSSYSMSYATNSCLVLADARFVTIHAKCHGIFIANNTTD